MTSQKTALEKVRERLIKLEGQNQGKLLRILCLFGFIFAVACSHVKQGPFAIVILPDTQFYSEKLPQPTFLILTSDMSYLAYS